MRIYLIALLIFVFVGISPVFATGSEPILLFNASPMSGPTPLIVQFTDLSQGEPVSWSWDFGDGSTSVLQNPEHTYTDEGFFDVSLKISNEYGQITGKKVNYIRVGIESTAGFSADPRIGIPPLSVIFIDLSSESLTSWEWDFGDGSNSTLQNLVHEYTLPGIYDVSLMVVSPVGNCYILHEDYINVGYPPEADIESSAVSGNAPLTVCFTDLSQNSPDVWLWSFGDGQSSTFQNPEHTFTAAGEYEVILTAENVFGSDIEILNTNISVHEPDSPVPSSDPVNPSPGPGVKPPVANFTADPLKGDAPLSVSFFDRSAGGVTEWRWNFGDGKMSCDNSPEHTYLYPGLYDVTLIIKNEYSGGSLRKTEYINVTGSAPAGTSDPPGIDTPSPDETDTIGTDIPKNPYYSGSKYGVNSAGDPGFGNGTDDINNTSSAGSPKDGGVLWFWWPLIGLILITLAAVVVYIWVQKHDGGGMNSL